jgi:dUTP pyrophosphatase
MNIEIINKSNNELPKYETIQSAGMDLRAHLTEPIILKPLERNIIKTGLFISLPTGYEAQIRPRSGLSIKSGITVLNSPGTIDSDYRGEIGIILINLSDTNFEINTGDRIAQMVIAKHEQVLWTVTDKLDDSERGNKGYGSTGI